MNAVAHTRVTKYCDLPQGFAVDGRFFCFESLTFGSGRVGYAVFGFFLLKTVDGGDTWCRVRHAAPKGFAPRSAFALGGMRCWVACASTTGVQHGRIPVLASDDGARRWNLSWVGNPADRYGSDSHLFFVDGRAGWLAATQYSDCGQRCALFKTTDGGAQWQVAHEPLDFSPQGLFFADSDEGYLLAASREQDRKRAFRVTLTDGPCRTEFLVGGHPTVLFRVTEGGVVLRSVMETRSSLHAIGGTGLVSLVACGAGGSLFRGDSNANGWQRVRSGTRSDLNDVDFARRGNQTAGLAVGEQGTILGSADEGITWHRLRHAIGRESLFRVQMTGVSSGVIAASDALYLIRVVE